MHEVFEWLGDNVECGQKGGLGIKRSQRDMEVMEGEKAYGGQGGRGKIRRHGGRKAENDEPKQGSQKFKIYIRCLVPA